ncbi:hypothetical protein [Acidisphaera sp. L21]|uniref:hypothetical protein n=1 Tax=Acidisphaera sp. L21 TaxID=1641851 RepID=UPI00131DD94A|nr:hypothetical protein [Acidisphaera sp. L21]
MNRVALLLAMAAATLLAACGPQPVARIPSSGVTAGAGGGERTLRNAPAGTGTCPTRASCAF